MSDNESIYESDNDSSSEISENEKIIIKPNSNIKKQITPNIDDYDDNDNDNNSLDEDEDENVDVDIDIDEDEENIQIGGVKENEIEEDSEEEELSDEEDYEEQEQEEEENKKKSNKKTNKTPVKTNIILPTDSDDEDDDDEYDDNYLQKFDSDTTNSYIKEFHPECLQHNYDEVAKFTSVIRDSNNIIIDPFHKTLPYLTKYEKARILGQRAKQIECGAKPLVKVPENIIDGYIIAELELQQKRIPFIIRRPIPGGAFEYWNLKDLENIAF
jgi:DNA-directed RNA polymerase I, II, and III subunit RPABC2